MDSALVANGQGIAPVSRILGVSRAQLTLRINTSGNKPDKRRQSRNEEADAEVLSRIPDIIRQKQEISDVKNMFITHFIGKGRYTRNAFRRINVLHRKEGNSSIIAWKVCAGNLYAGRKI